MRVMLWLMTAVVAVGGYLYVTIFGGPPSAGMFLILLFCASLAGIYGSLST
jgi:hypothetical protein